MNRILKIREKRAKAWEDAKKYLDEKRKSDGTISAEDEAVHDNMKAEVTALGIEIDRMECQEVIDRELAAATTTHIVTKPEKTDNTRTGIASDSYKKAFRQQIRNQNSYEIRNALQEGCRYRGRLLCPPMSLSVHSLKHLRREISSVRLLMFLPPQEEHTRYPL